MSFKTLLNAKGEEVTVSVKDAKTGEIVQVSRLNDLSDKSLVAEAKKNGATQVSDSATGEQSPL